MLAIIGCGEISTKVLRELLNKKIVEPKGVIATRRQVDDLADLVELGVNVEVDNRKAAKSADIIILGLRPQHMDEVLTEIKDLIDGKLVISFAIGLNLNHYKNFLPKADLVRVMPNPFLSSHSGVIAFCKDVNCSTEAEARVRELFEPLCDKLLEIEEGQMHAFTSLASSGSAYYNFFFDAMVDYAVTEGFDQSIAKMIVLITGKAAALEANVSEESFDEMIADACTPGGMTIEGIKQLKKNNVKELVKRALKKSTERSREIEKDLG